jgi:hypothetical protein
MKTKIAKLALGVVLFALVAAPRFVTAAVVVAEPTGDADPAFLSELKASLETVAADAPAEMNAELRSSATNSDAGVELVVELVPNDGSKPIRESRTASKASALAQVRAMARKLFKPVAPAAAPPPTVVEIAEPPAPPRPALPRPPTKFRLESTAFAGLFWIGDVKKPTGGLDFGVGWSFADRVGLGVRLAISWVELSYSCDDDECGIRPDDYELESPDDLYWAEKSGEEIHRRITTTLLTLAFDLSLGNMRLVYVDILAGLRSCFSSVGEEFMEIPLPYVALGLNLTPVRNERVALLLRIDVGYYTLAAIYSPADNKGLEPHGAVGIQF